jgi:flagellar biosynthesis protein FlhG
MEMLQQRLDQAGTLRSMSDRFSGTAADASATLEADRQAARVLSVTSGKGGVGKTAVVSNVALALAQMGKKVLIIDADLGLANIDVVFGLTPQYNLNHFFNGDRSLLEIMVEGPGGIKILPAGSGMQTVTRLSSEQKMKFLDDLDSLHGDFEVVIIDTEAGISENVTYFNVAAQDILVVTTPEPTAITDAYALMKLLSVQYHEKRFNLIVNSVRDAGEALDVYRKLTMVSNRYLDISIDYLGCVPQDKRMREAVRRQRVMVDLFPRTKASAAFETIARNLITTPQNVGPKGSLQFFWRRLLSFGQGA